MASYAHTFTSGDTVTPTKLNNARTVSEIVNADIKSDAAIAGTKIAPNFGSQNVTTTGSLSGKDLTLTEGLSAFSSITANAAAGNSAYINLGTGFTSGYVSFDRADNAMAVWNATNGFLNFGTNNAQRMRIAGDGSVLIGTTTPIDPTTGSADGATFWQGISLRISNTGNCLLLRRRSSNGAIMTFSRDTTTVGSISVTATETAYNTSSDYRLKQNIEPMTGGLAKLAALAPKTFEFKAEPNVKVDGFIAHEVQAIVPQAVTGEKDGEEMQGLDNSKLVPVLVAAVQELAAEVEALKSAQ